MRLLFIGDIFATPGMRVMQAFLKRHADDYDFIIANGENAAGGFGITRKHFDQMRAAGVDVVTLGNHSWDQAEVQGLLEETTRLIRPVNYPPGTPGLGSASFTARGGERITVAQAMGRVFMEPMDDPFRALDEVAQRVPPDEALLVDFHAEATSEKKVMGFHLRGRAAAVVGTHTHVPTADETIFEGTAYITDVGMTGVQESSLGMSFEEVHYRFVARMPKRYRPADRPGTLNGVAIDIVGGKATSIERIRWRKDDDEE